MALDLKAIEGAFKKIEKSHAVDIVDLENYGGIEWIPTASPALNKILGGGSPRGRILALEGENNMGKSLLCYIFGRAHQNVGDFCLYIDHENSFTEDFANAQGLITTPDKFRLARPESLTDSFELMETMIRAGVRCIILDSIALAPVIQEIDGDYDKQFMAVKARVLAQGLRKIVPLVHETGTNLYFTNHLTVDPSITYGSNLVNPGGRSQNYAYSIRLRVRRTGYITQGEDTVGFKVDVKTFKNKVASPNQTCSLTFMYKTGLDTFTDVIDAFIENDIVHKGGGGNYTFEGLNGEPLKIRGMVNLIDFFKEHEDLFESYKIKIGLVKEAEEE